MHTKNEIQCTTYYSYFQNGVSSESPCPKIFHLNLPFPLRYLCCRRFRNLPTWPTQSCKPLIQTLSISSLKTYQTHWTRSLLDFAKKGGGVVLCFFAEGVWSFMNINLTGGCKGVSCTRKNTCLGKQKIELDFWSTKKKNNMISQLFWKKQASVFQN